MIGTPTKLGLLFASVLCCGAVAPAIAGLSDEPAPATQVSFELDVQPILSAAGCNSGPCHGKARGQNGFQLSLLGFDPDFDFAAIAKEGRGRRVFPAAPDESLLLRKPTAQVPHGGGKGSISAGRTTIRCGAGSSPACRAASRTSRSSNGSPSNRPNESWPPIRTSR